MAARLSWPCLDGMIACAKVHFFQFELVTELVVT